MPVIELEISKNWFTATTVQETNWDRIRDPLITWATATNRNLEQIARDAFGASYSLDNDGAANLATDLQTQINNIVGGATPFAASVDGDFLISFRNTQANAAASTNETVTYRFGFGTDIDVGRIVMGKEGDYTVAANSDSFMAFHTDLNGTLAERLRITSDGHVAMDATSRLYLDGSAATGDT
mgnify:CR=1 FL=1